MNADMEFPFRAGAKFCAAVAMAALVFAALGPGEWVPRTGLGFELEHFLALFVVTSIVCAAWPRPIVVGPILVVVGILLEVLQALTPDRLPNLIGSICSAAGALSAALIAGLVIRLRRWRARLILTDRKSNE